MSDMPKLLRNRFLFYFGKIISRAAKYKQPAPLVIKLPDNNKTLGRIAREQMHQKGMFKALVENAWEVVACLAPDCTVTYITDAVTRIIGYRPDEIVGRIGFDFVAPEDRMAIVDLFEQVVLNIRPTTVVEFRLVSKSGQKKWVHCTGINLLANSHVNSVVIYYHDITESKKIKDEVAEGRQRLSLAMKSAKMGTFDWDLKTDLSVWSEETEALYGFSPGQYKGTLEEIETRMAPGEFERIKPIAQAAIQSGTEYSVEYKIIHPDGSEHWVANRGKPQLGATGKPVRVVGVASDVTEQKAREQLLIESEQRFRAASEAKSQFLANMSHEIRTPLGAILGFTDLIRDPGLSQKDRMQYAEIVHQNGYQLATVINDILDLSKVEAGKLDVQPCVFSLASLVAETASFLRPLADERKVLLNVAPVPPTLPERIYSDPARVKQVLTNIIGNAIKFTRSGGTITVSLKTKNVGPKQCAIIDVQDTGIGMDREQQRQIFDAFFQGDSSMTRKYGGTGLGLSLSQHLSKLLGGDLQLIQSTLGQGSTFRFSFEITIASEDRTTDLPSQLAPRKSISGIRVLLAEDSPDNQLLISHILSSEGAHVDTVDNGEQAVEQAFNQEYDVILMDIQMPILDGYKATEILRRKGYKGKIVALTAHALLEERDHSFAVGCDDHLTKPVNRAKLIETVAG